MASEKISLLPSQSKALERVLGLWPCSDVFTIWSRAGLGRTTLMRELARKVDRPQVLGARRYATDLAEEPPLRLEETFLKRALRLLDRCDTLFIDDWERISCTFGHCNYSYPRVGVAKSIEMALLDTAARKGRKLVFISTGTVDDELESRGLYVGWDRLAAEDYAGLFAAVAPEVAQRVDVRRVFDFAPRLTLLQLKGALQVLRRDKEVDTDRVIDYLQQLKMASNINVSQVRDVALEDLKGVDDVLAGLKRYVITPLAEEQLAREHGVRPKRGILLYGPPGTGKTTVGRALAHRLRSKFFRIDGTALIFIDDCDTIFEDKDEYGLYRYLLTKMDGLESEDMASVSVMLTAMNVSSLPPALIRSGRIELWLEMRLPDRAARHAILDARTARLDRSHGELDLAAIADATDGFTGADLDRLVKDARALLIGELAAQRPVISLTVLFLEAAQEVRRNMDVIRKATREAEIKQMATGAMNPFTALMRRSGGGEEDPLPPTG